jgi:hypothetical protein
MGNTVKYPVTTLLKEGDYFDIPVKKKRLTSEQKRNMVQSAHNSVSRKVYDEELGGMRRNMPFKVVTKWLEDGSALRVTRGADVYGS